MRTKEQELILLKDVLKTNRFNGRHDHLVADCPFCGKKNHLYLNHLKAFNLNYNDYYVNSWDCKKCGETGNIWKLFKEYNAVHYLQVREVIGDRKKIETLISPGWEEPNIKELDLSPLPTRRLPMGFRRIYYSKYLAFRGFHEHEFEKYIIGRTSLKANYQGYIICALVENKEVKGWLGRWEGKKVPPGKPKYQNSKRTDTGRMLMGYDEINFLVDTVILVEGWIDKVKVDRILKLNSLDSSIKCCVTFGKNLTAVQAKKLELKGIKNLILGYDPDAIDVIKKLGMSHVKNFNVKAIWLDSEGDLGDSSERKVLDAFTNAKEIYRFRNNIVSSKLIY